MSKLSCAATPVCSLGLALLTLAGCATEPAGEPGVPLGVASPAPAHAVLGSFVMKVQPARRRADVFRLPPEALGPAGLLQPQNLDDLTIVATTGAQPADTVNLVTDESSLVDTYNTGAMDGCAANSFCAGVTLTHSFAGLDLSAVYVQIIAVTSATNTTLTGHGAENGVSSTPFGLDLTEGGAWQYTPIPGSLAAGVGSPLTWELQNPDDQVTNIYLNVVAAMYPMLWFDTGAITQTAPLLAGQPAILHYTYARNTSCRGSSWSMQGYWKGDNIDIHTTSWPGVSTDTFFDQIVVMPFGPGLDFWFNNTDGTGCNSYDSNGGSNFNYGITDTNTRIHFAGPSANQNPYYSTAWQVYADSGVKAGVTIGVDYELDRVVCGGLDCYGRVPSGTAVTMYYSLDGGAFTTVDMLGLPYDVPSSINGSAGQVLVPPSIAIPSTSHSLSVYFDSTGPSSCHNYDSNYGSNYSFTY